MRQTTRPAAIAIAGGLIALLATDTAFAAEIPKCSAPDALAGLQELARAQLEDTTVPQVDKPVYALRFPNGPPQLGFSQFVGKAADEASRHCTVKIELGSPGMATVAGPFEYDLEITEDGKLLYAPDSTIREQLKQLVSAYDAENGLTQKILKLALTGLGIDLSGSAGLLKNYDAANPNRNTPPPPLPGHTTSDFGTPSDRPRPSLRSMRTPQ